MVLRLRLRGPAGKQHTTSLPASATFGDLQTEVASVFGIVDNELEILTGFPPTLCVAESDTLLDGLVKNSDSVIVRQSTGQPATQAMSIGAFSTRRSRALPVFQQRIAPVLSPIAPRSINRQVNLFWKISMENADCLDAVKLPHDCKHLERVSEPYVCLLFFGGRDEAAAARHEGLSLECFHRIHSTLSAIAGKRVSVVANAIGVHREIVFATVSLPDDVLHHQGYHQGRFIATPIMNFRVRPGAPGNIARSVLAKGTGLKWVTLTEPFRLTGIIQLETASPLHPSQFGKEVHLAEEMRGQLVLVRKHSSMNCAVLTFSSSSIRDSVLRKCLDNGGAQLHGAFLNVKPHVPNRLDQKQDRLPEQLFVAWQEERILCEDLMLFFDGMAGASIDSSSLRLNNQVAEELLRTKPESDADKVPDDGTWPMLDDILVLRLTRMARSAEVTAILLGSEVLEQCRQRMAVGGYEITPPWAGGAKLFVPLEQKQVEPLIVLQHFHIVAYSCDVYLIQKALSAMSCRTRPKLAQDQLLFQHEDDKPFVVERSLRTHSSLGFPTMSAYP